MKRIVRVVCNVYAIHYSKNIESQGKMNRKSETEKLSLTRRTALHICAKNNNPKATSFLMKPYRCIESEVN